MVSDKLCLQRDELNKICRDRMHHLLLMFAESTCFHLSRSMIIALFLFGCSLVVFLFSEMWIEQMIKLEHIISYSGVTYGEICKWALNFMFSWLSPRSSSVSVYMHMVARSVTRYMNMESVTFITFIEWASDVF